MKDPRITLAVAVGVVGLIAGLAGALADLAVLGALAGAAAAGAAIIAVFVGRDHGADRAENTKLRSDVGDLEGALASQVQARITAEEAVRSLGDQLASAQREVQTKASQLGIPREERVADALTDAATGLFSEDYFRVAVDSRIAAARRHLRPVGVVLLEVVEGLRSGEPRPAHPVLVAETITTTLREADTACRMQDGRYGLVLEDTGENGAIWTVERIRRSLAEQGDTHTLRAGIACYPAHAFGAVELLQRADAALTSARDWQQDRIEVANAD